MNSDVLIAVITVSGTILISVIGLIISRYLQQKREQEVAHRDKKTEMYDKYLKDLALNSEDKNDKPIEKSKPSSKEQT